MGGLRGRRHPARRRARRPGRRLRGRHPRRLRHPAAPARAVGHHPAQQHRRAARHHRQPRVLRAGPDRAEPHRGHGPVVVTGRRAPGDREPAPGRVRHRGGGRRQPQPGAALRGGRRPLRRPLTQRPLRHLRRVGRRLRARRGRRGRAAQAAGPGPRRRR